MPARIDITGQRFGRLIVLKSIKERKWQCQCNCGNIVNVRGKALTGNRTKSCGCLSRDISIKDITGQRFGRLVALKMSGSKKGRIVWECKCDCGNTVFVSGLFLRRKTRPKYSCGCLIKDKLGQVNRARIKDLTNQRFGRLTAMKLTKKQGKKHINIWKCRCDCGNIAFVTINNLKAISGTRSCGCLKIASYFVRGTNIDSMDVPFEITYCIQARTRLKKAIKQAS